MDTKEREASIMFMIRKMKNRVIRDHGLESGVTISFFRACDEYQDGMLSLVLRQVVPLGISMVMSSQVSTPTPVTPLS